MQVIRPHHKRSRFDRLPPPPGFTLVEMLVVVSLLLIITLMTIGAVNFTMNAERIRTAARQMQSFMEGARSRAIYARENRGVRFILDPNENVLDGRKRTVTSMVYIGPTEPWTEGRIIMMKDIDPITLQPTGSQDVLTVRGINTGWFSLLSKRLIQPARTRIRIPAGDLGTWYTIRQLFLDQNNREYIQLVTPYRQSADTPPASLLAFESGLPNTYEIELPLSVLPNQEPTLLPQGIVVDLDLSDIPPLWYTGATGNRIYSPQMDVLFTPRGGMVGPAAAKGIIHFFLVSQEDLDLGRHAINQQMGLNGIRFDDGTDPSGPGPSGDKLIITLMTNTGNVSSHPVDITDAINNQTQAFGADGFADDPFRFAEIGEVAGQ